MTNEVANEPVLAGALMLEDIEVLASVFAFISQPHDFIGVMVTGTMGELVTVSVVYTGGISGYTVGQEFRLSPDTVVFRQLTPPLMAALETPDVAEPAKRGLDDEYLEEIVSYALDFLPESGPVDWEYMLDKLDKVFKLGLPDDMLAPEIKRIKAAINKARREG